MHGDIVGLEREAFGHGAFSEGYLAGEFTAPENAVILLVDPDNDGVLGFTLAGPVEWIDPQRLSDNATAYVSDTIIAQAWRGQGLVGVLMDALEQELRNRGYRFMERDAAIAHGYADKVARHYKERIVLMDGPHDSEWGPQVFFRIRL